MDDNVKHPTGFLWVIGLYFAAYQVAVLNYQGAVDPLNRKVDQIRVGVDQGDHKYWLALLPKVQNTQTLTKPDIWDPALTVKSLLGTEDYNPNIITSLKEVVVSLGLSSKLAGSFLEEVDLSEANLFKANLAGSHLAEAYLSKTDLSNANLKGADLTWANLSNTRLGGANLEEAGLEGADLRWASLSFANLKGADLGGAYLEGTNLGWAYIIKTDLERTYLGGANLTGALLREALLAEANLEGASLEKADLTGVDLLKTKKLTCKQVLTAIIDKKTQLPEYLTIKWKTDGSYSCKEKKD